MRVFLKSGIFRNFGLIIILLILLIGGYFFINLFESNLENKNLINMKTLNGKKVAILIAFKDFEDEEYFISKNMLEKVDANVITVSNQVGDAIGSDGGEVSVDLTFGKLKLEEVKALILIGGQGSLKYLDNEEVYDLIRNAYSKNKLIGALSISPIILAKSGILKNKKATVWSSFSNKTAVNFLQSQGVLYEKSSIVIDKNIITANNTKDSGEFIKEIINYLSK